MARGGKQRRSGPVGAGQRLRPAVCEHAAQDLNGLVAFRGGDIEWRQKADGIVAGGNDEQSGGDQSFGQTQGRCSLLALVRGEVLDFRPEKESGAAHFADEGKLSDRGAQLFAAFACVGQEIFFLDRVENRVGRGAGEW